MCSPVRWLLPKDVSLFNPAVILQQSNGGSYTPEGQEHSPFSLDQSYM